MSIHFNLGSHDGRTISDLTTMVENSERAAFTTSTSSAATGEVFPSSPQTPAEASTIQSEVGSPSPEEVLKGEITWQN